MTTRTLLQAAATMPAAFNALKQLATTDHKVRRHFSSAMGRRWSMEREAAHVTFRDGRL